MSRRAAEKQATVETASFYDNTDHLLRMGYRPARDNDLAGAWVLWVMGTNITGYVPRAEVLTALGRKDAR